MEPLSAKTSFDPAKHGFKFVNSFDIDPRLFGSKGKEVVVRVVRRDVLGCDCALGEQGATIPDLTHVP